MPAPNFSEPLAWADSPLNSPLATYDVDFSTSLQWKWDNLKGYYQLVEQRAKFVRIDNLDSNQFLNVYFDNLRFPVNAFQLLTLPIPDGSLTCRIEGDASSLLACEVTFAVVNINQADTINFKAIQALGGEGVLFPIDFRSGPYNPLATDQLRVQLWTISGGTAVQLLDPTVPANAIVNGWSIPLWSNATSTANVTVTAQNGVLIEGQASLIIEPGDRYWIVCDGTEYRIFDATQKNPVTQIFTASGNWSQSDLSRILDYVVAEVVGGGGAGGGAAATAAGNASAGAGGGSGAYARKQIDASTLAASVVVTVGVGGTGVAANTGNTGGTSSFGAHCSATGGLGGTVGLATGAVVPGGIGGTGGTASGGDLNIDGSGGKSGFRMVAQGLGGEGAGSQLSGSPFTVGSGVGRDGETGLDYGGGGNGGSNGPSVAILRSGGGGAAGIVIVTEFYK